MAIGQAGRNCHPRRPRPACAYIRAHWPSGRPDPDRRRRRPAGRIAGRQRPPVRVGRRPGTGAGNRHRHPAGLLRRIGGHPVAADRADVLAPAEQRHRRTTPGRPSARAAHPVPARRPAGLAWCGLLPGDPYLVLDCAGRRTVRWWSPPKPVLPMAEGAPALRDALRPRSPPGPRPGAGQLRPRRPGLHRGLLAGRRPGADRAPTPRPASIRWPTTSPGPSGRSPGSPGWSTT